MMAVHEEAARFRQCFEIRRAMDLCDDNARKVEDELEEVKTRLKEIRRTKASLQADLLDAAAGKSKLPLFAAMEVAADTVSQRIPGIKLAHIDAAPE